MVLVLCCVSCRNSNHMVRSQPFPSSPVLGPPASVFTEFGITRVIRALEPLYSNLDASRWRAACLCFLGMLDAASKHMVQLKDTLVADLLGFLEDVEEAGAQGSIAPAAAVAGTAAGGEPQQARPTIRSEARAIHAVLLKICDP